MLRAGGIALIGFYQRWLSPLKGFRCAHHVRHERLSCSQYIKRALAKHGVFLLLPLMRRRFDRCALAAAALERERPAQGEGQSEKRLGGETGRKRKPARCCGQEQRSFGTQRQDPGCCDAPMPVCDVPCGSPTGCDPPSSCDLPGVDVPDCGGCDVSF